MAKKAKSAKKPKRPGKSSGEGAALLSKQLKAASIVADVLAHFGGGYEAERQSESPGTPIEAAPIYKNAGVAQTFHFSLLASTLRNFESIRWDQPLGDRDTVCAAAFKHGRLARKAAKAPLTTAVIFKTLEEVKKDCPGGPGGGRVCDFD